MNRFCIKVCKHVATCNLDEEKTYDCCLYSPPDGKIFNKTWEEISDKQQKEVATCQKKKTYAGQ